MSRTGPQMRWLASCVIDGESICSLVDRRYRTRRGHRSRSFGYRAVHRAIAAGLIRAELGKNGRYMLFKPETK